MARAAAHIGNFLVPLAGLWRLAIAGTRRGQRSRTASHSESKPTNSLKVCGSNSQCNRNHHPASNPGNVPAAIIQASRQSTRFSWA